MKARRYDVAMRMPDFTSVVYGGVEAKPQQLKPACETYYPEPSRYKVFFGELHGHTNLSDGRGDIDGYFTTARDTAKLDFCALSDHDHGGVGKPELWGEKWDLIQEKVQQYHVDGEFVTILAYERDSYPWYNNAVLYYKKPTGEMVRSSVDGEITAEELACLLTREDIITIPHTTSFFPSGCDFQSIPLDLMTPLMEVYSRWGTSEYMGNANPCKIETDGGFWRDALERGVRMGCMAGSDDHHGYPGLDLPEDISHPNLRYRQPGLTAVLAEELTREAIFDALRAKRCYACRGARIQIDVRLNGEVLGSELMLAADCRRDLYLLVNGEDLLKTVTIVKNGRDYMVFHVDGESQRHEELIFDYAPERPTDYYYVRVEQLDGRMAWTSPIWVSVSKR